MADGDSSGRVSELVFVPRTEMCLDFANTLAYRGSSPTESLHTFADLLKWCADAKVIPLFLSHQLRGWSEKHPRRVADFFSNVIALRELVYRIFHARASGVAIDDTDLEDLNRALRDAPPRAAIRSAGESFGWEVEESKPS